MEIKDMELPQFQNNPHQLHTSPSPPTLEQFISGHKLEFKNLILEYSNETTTKDFLNLTIEQGEVVHIYEKSHRSRDLLLAGLTRNLSIFTDPSQFRAPTSTIKLGGVSIKDTTR